MFAPSDVRPERARFLIGVALMAGLLTMVPSVLAAQVVRGRLLAKGTGDPIATGRVALLDADGNEVDEALTNAEGAFQLEAPEPGDYFVKAQRIGYQPMIDGILELGEGGSITIEFYLPLEPITIEGLRATVKRELGRRYLESAGFFDRMKQGAGYFVTPADLQERPVFDHEELFRRVPAVRIIDEGIFGSQIQISRGGSCTPIIYVDGALASSPGMGGIALEDIVDVSNIEAVEVYPGVASMPSQYASSNACGAVIFWTKTGVR